MFEGDPVIVTEGPYSGTRGSIMLIDGDSACVSPSEDGDPFWCDLDQLDLDPEEDD